VKAQNCFVGGVSRFGIWIVFIVCGVVIDVSSADEATWGNLAPVRKQYQNIKTLHVKSQMLVESNEVPVPPNTIQWINYEQWADSYGRYKTICSYAEPNGNVLFDYEFAYNGRTFYTFEKQDKVISYGKNDPNENPIPENPLLLPVFFLGRHSDECHCPLKLRDVLNVGRWQDALAQSESVDVLDGPKKAIKMPTARMRNGEKFDLLVSVDPNGLIEKTERIGVSGNTLTSIVFSEYQGVDVAGKKTYWPKTVKITEYEPKQNSATTLTAQINLVELDNIIPDEVFTVDFASAKHVWDNDANMFVK
jgi:hypothetical protein